MDILPGIEPFLDGLPYSTAVAAAANDSIGPSSLPPAPQLTDAALIRSIILFTMALGSIIGNIYTIRNIRKSRVAKKLRHSCTAIYLLITHLSLADLLVTFFCMIGDAVWGLTVQWLAGDFMCKFLKFFQMFSLYLSTYVLVLIGLDRLMAVKYPMKMVNMGPRSRSSLICVYSLSAVFSLPQIFLFRVSAGPFEEVFHQCVTHGSYTEDWQEQLYTTATLILMFLIPLLFLIGTYLSTFRSISHSESLFSPEMSMTTNGGQQETAITIEKVGWMVRSAYANRQKLLQRAKYKSLKMSVLIILAFIICWTPYYIMMVIFMFTSPDQETSEVLQSVIFFFGMSNSLINPLIYGLFHLMPKRRKFFNNFQSSQTRTAVGEVSHNLIASNKKLISRIGGGGAGR